MALSNTIDLVRLALKGDGTITPDVQEEVIALLEGKRHTGLTDNTPIDRCLSREEVAKIMGVSPRTITSYAKEGIIASICNGTQGKRASGYSEKSVREAMAKRRRNLVAFSQSQMATTMA